MDGVFVHESLLQQAEDDQIRCNVCARRCLLAPHEIGWCRTREHDGSRLVTRTYGAISSLESAPIEKQSFYHFYPGTRALTAGSWSCNLGCPWCENWEISHVAPPSEGDYISPERFVGWAEGSDCQGVCLSFNEPTLSLEWAIDVFEIARPRGLYNTFITNGYMTPESLELLVEAGLDALNVDIKGDAATVAQFCQGDAEMAWAICKLAAKCGVHVEVSTLIIPTINDSTIILRDIAERLLRELGPEVPWHLKGYSPAYLFDLPATPRASLESAWTTGEQARLEYVYIDNVPGHRNANTHCPECDALLIRRLGADVLLNALRNGACPECKHLIPGVWNR
ncbi:MAG: AmmeMemoRadiSam system radical SAM enzyme [Anaerolineae bacterium]